MAQSKWFLGSGRRGAGVLLCALVISILGLTPAPAEAAPPSVSAEISTAAQFVVVTLQPSDASSLVIHLDQFGSGEMNGVTVPPGFVGVGNLQVFAGPEREEKTDFSKAPMHITLGNQAGGLGKITTFGLLVKPQGDTKGEWVFWKARGGGSEDLEKLGFKGEFFAGNPAHILVRQWPKGDPCMCR